MSIGVYRPCSRTCDRYDQEHDPMPPHRTFQRRIVAGPNRCGPHRTINARWTQTDAHGLKAPDRSTRPWDK
jgi:hypothetical protein